MEITKLPIEDINPAKYNPRKDLKPGDDEYEKLKRSIQEFDLVEPLIVNKRGNVLVGGHQRLKVLIELGHTETEVSLVDLPPSKEKALNINLNKIAGEWDFPALKDLLEELDGEIDLDLTGFTADDIDILMGSVDAEDYSEFDEMNDGLAGAEDCTIGIVVPARHEESVREWLAEGYENTGPGMGKGVLKKCGLL